MLGKKEAIFANLIWDNEPINSSELVRLAEEKLHWKKSTTYTMLKRLSERGVFENKNATVKAVIPREVFYGRQSQKYVDETFGGSLPKFIAAFFGGKKLSDKQANELVQLINEHVDT